MSFPPPGLDNCRASRQNTCTSSKLPLRQVGSTPVLWGHLQPPRMPKEARKKKKDSAGGARAAAQQLAPSSPSPPRPASRATRSRASAAPGAVHARNARPRHPRPRPPCDLHGVSPKGNNGCTKKTLASVIAFIHGPLWLLAAPHPRAALAPSSHRPTSAVSVFVVIVLGMCAYRAYGHTPAASC